MKLKLNLQYFGEGGGEGASTSSGSATAGTSGINAEQPVSEVGSPTRGRKGNPLANVQYGKPSSDDMGGQGKDPEVMTSTAASEDKAVNFENLIKGEYKDEFDKRVQNIINKRFSSAKANEEKLNALNPMLDMLASKYGKDSSDVQGLVKAIEDDDAYYEEEALDKGLTVQQLKQMKQLERENANLRNAQQEAERQQMSQQIYSKWMEQTAELNQKYGLNVDFAEEAANDDFVAILKHNGSVEAAYKAVHFDEMMGGAMFKTAQAVTEKMANNLQSKASRPLENGVSSRASALTKSDVHSFTKADRAEIERRVLRGEKIVL